MAGVHTSTSHRGDAVIPGLGIPTCRFGVACGSLVRWGVGGHSSSSGGGGGVLPHIPKPMPLPPAALAPPPPPPAPVKLIFSRRAGVIFASPGSPAVRFFISLNANVGGNMQLLDFCAIAVCELQNLGPQVCMRHFTHSVPPLVPAPPLCQAKHTIYHYFTIWANERPCPWDVPLQCSERCPECPSYIGLWFVHGQELCRIPVISKIHSITPDPPHLWVLLRRSIWMHNGPSILHMTAYNRLVYSTNSAARANFFLFLQAGWCNVGSGLSGATRTLGCSNTVDLSMALNACSNSVISHFGREGLGWSSHSDRILIRV